MSVDYGDDIWDIVEDTESNWHTRMIRSRHIINNTEANPYIKRMFEFAEYDELGNKVYVENDDKYFNYQFYHPNVLIWLKEIIEHHTGKQIFVFSHHFLPHNACLRLSLNFHKTSSS